MINIGDKVLIKQLNKKGVVINKYHNGIYIVEFETLNFQLKSNEIEKLTEPIHKVNKNNFENSLFKTKKPFNNHVKPLEIDLHGFNLKEAKAAVEEIIQKAISQKITVVHIIHGKGTGVLRVGIQDLLKTFKLKKLITNYNYAENYEGSYGKTIVYI